MNGRDDLIHEAVFDVVGEHFPDEAPALPALWKWWLAFRGSSGAAAVPNAGLPAMGPPDDASYSAMLILTISAVVSDWVPGEEQPTPDVIKKAIYAAARAFGFAGTRLDRVVSASAAKLTAVLSRVESPPVVSAAPSGALWVEVSVRGKRESARAASPAEITKLRREQSFDLVIDETQRSFIQKDERLCPFNTFEPRVQQGLWVVLQSDGGVTYELLEECFAILPGERERVYALINSVRKAFKQLLGGDKGIIGHNKSNTYAIDASWSWCWVREVQNRRQSRLLSNPFVGPSERAKL